MWDDDAANTHAHFFSLTRTHARGQIDGTENDTPHDIQGFPTLKFFPAGRKDQPIDYTGERSVDAIVKFVKENADTLKSQPSGSASASAAGKDEL